MSKLSKEVLDEFFAIHLPYRIRVLRAHQKMCAAGPWQGDKSQLESCFEASLVTGRMFLNALGLSRTKKDELIRRDGWDDDVTAEHLGGNLVDLKTLSPGDISLFVGFLKMADKGAAHLTLPMAHDWERAHEALDRIEYYLKTNIYDPAQRVISEVRS